MIDGSLHPNRSTTYRLLALVLGVIYTLAATGCLPTTSLGLALANGTQVDLPTPKASLPHALELPSVSAAQPGSKPLLTLQAASGQMIEFTSQDGKTEGGLTAQSFEIPHLVLFRNGRLTDATERSLIIDIQGLAVPAQGLAVTLTLETQHTLPSTEAGEPQNILVWSHTLEIISTQASAYTATTSITAQVEFTATIPTIEGPIVTPTDYYRLIFSMQDMSLEDNLQTASLEYALLLEDQWIAQLPPVQGSVPNVAPQEMVVYYCDMFQAENNASLMTRNHLIELIEGELIPRFVEGFELEGGAWGFTWQPGWTSYRVDDKPGTLSIALSDGETWYHGATSTFGNATISLTLSAWSPDQTDTLSEGVLSTFYHELFHNLQRSMLQHQEGSQEIRGKASAWEYISEGTANLASSIAQPDVEFGSMSRGRGYLSYTNLYLSGGYEPGKYLNLSLRQLVPYTSALYWRFLYERCGGMSRRIEDPKTGMDVIRRASEVLYSGEVVDIAASDDLVTYFPAVMDRALRGSACPFQTFDESWRQFAHAVYSLRLEGGRCTAPGEPAGCELYDPQWQYHEPPAVEITYRGREEKYAAQDQGPFPGIRGSFGMDFVEIDLAPEMSEQALKVEFSGEAGGVSVFGVEVLVLRGDGSGGPTALDGTHPIFTGTWDGKASTRALVFEVSSMDLEAYDRLGVIITRLDNQEAVDPLGAYTIQLEP